MQAENMNMFHQSFLAYGVDTGLEENRMFSSHTHLKAGDTGRAKKMCASL